MRAQVATFAGCLDIIPSQFARSQAIKKKIRLQGIIYGYRDRFLANVFISRSQRFGFLHILFYNRKQINSKTIIRMYALDSPT
jgi:hypothetical protein